MQWISGRQPVLTHSASSIQQKASGRMKRLTCKVSLLLAAAVVSAVLSTAKGSRVTSVGGAWQAVAAQDEDRTTAVQVDEENTPAQTFATEGEARAEKAMHEVGTGAQEERSQDGDRLSGNDSARASVTRSRKWKPFTLHLSRQRDPFDIAVAVAGLMVGLVTITTTFWSVLKERAAKAARPAHRLLDDRKRELAYHALLHACHLLLLLTALSLARQASERTYR